MSANGRTVLVSVDASRYSERAFDWCLENVLRDEDNVIVLHCQEPLHSPSPMFPYASQSEELAKLIQDHTDRMNQLVEKYKAKCEAKKLKAKIKVEGGKPGETICRVAAAEKVNCIVIGSRGLSTLRRTLIGGVSGYVVHHAHVPVIIVPEAAVDHK